MIRTLFPIPPPKTERDIAREIRAYLESQGLRVFRADASLGRNGRRSGATGLPDLFCVLAGGRFLGVEVKKPSARPRADEAKQNDVLDYLREQGAIVIVATSVERLKLELEAREVSIMANGARIERATPILKTPAIGPGTSSRSEPTKMRRSCTPDFQSACVKRPRPSKSLGRFPLGGGGRCD